MQAVDVTNRSWNVINHSTRRQFDTLRWRLSRKNMTSLKLQQLNLFSPRYNLGHLTLET